MNEAVLVVNQKVFSLVEKGAKNVLLHQNEHESEKTFVLRAYCYAKEMGYGWLQDEMDGVWAPVALGEWERIDRVVYYISVDSEVADKRPFYYRNTRTGEALEVQYIGTTSKEETLWEFTDSLGESERIYRKEGDSAAWERYLTSFTRRNAVRRYLAPKPM